MTYLAIAACGLAFAALCAVAVVVMYAICNWVAGGINEEEGDD